MSEDKYTIMRRCYSDYPSQDNEGYIPDRGGFKIGFYAAWDYLTGKGIETLKPPKPSETAVDQAWEKNREREEY